MKRIIILLGWILSLICLESVSSKAQDIIIKIDGTEIEAYVDEVSEEQIQYRRYDNPAGPTYKLSIAKIARIEYENGYVEEYKPVDSAEDVPAPQPVAPAPQPVAPEPVKKEEKKKTGSDSPKKTKRATPKNAHGLSFGAFMSWELLHPRMYTDVMEGLTYSGLRPTVYLDYHFASWIYLGINAFYAERSASKNVYASMNSLSLKYKSQDLGVNGHLGIQIPFSSSRKYGISVYGGPSFSWNLGYDTDYTVNNSIVQLNAPDRKMDMTLGVKLKGFVCLTAEYHFPIGENRESSHIGIPSYYWSLGVGLGF